jgi:hypothetical protein
MEAEVMWDFWIFGFLAPIVMEILKEKNPVFS